LEAIIAAPILHTVTVELKAVEPSDPMPVGLLINFNGIKQPP